MESIITDYKSHKKGKQHQENTVKDFYENATADYKHWSKKYNMHFGYYTSGMNPFCRETMLEGMNKYIMQKLEIKTNSKETLIDLGCGMGASMRYITEHKKQLRAIGYTISEWQLKEGNAYLKQHNCTRASIQLADICKAPKVENHANYAIALESLCHTPGTGKEEAIKQLARQLKKGGRFVIADAFALKDPKTFGPIANYVHRKICDGWQLPTLANVKKICEALCTHGFGQLKVENISWKVAPSVLHVPFAIIGFLLKNLIQGKQLGIHSINNLKGSFATLLSSLCMNEIAYCVISGEKIK